MAELNTHSDVGNLTYEQARDELRNVVMRLEAGGEPLEASLALWERGEALASRCQEWLDGARTRLAEAQERSGQRGAAENQGADDADLDADVSGQDNE